MTNRELAIWWFDGFAEAVSGHIDRGALATHRRTIAEGTYRELSVQRVHYRYSADRCAELSIETDEPHHGASGWIFASRNWAALAAIYELAMEDL